MKKDWIFSACLSAIVACSFIGLALNVAAAPFPWDSGTGKLLHVISINLLIVSAIWGSFMALKMLLMERDRKNFMHENARMPASMMVNGEEGVAMVTTVGGDLISIPIPQEILEGGPEAVVAYITEELDD
jgi:hypothetical protein